MQSVFSQATRAPNIWAMVQHFNGISAWVTKEICFEVNIKRRVSLFSKCIDIMQALLDLNNLNGVMEFSAGLYSSATYRLTETKKVGWFVCKATSLVVFQFSSWYFLLMGTTYHSYCRRNRPTSCNTWTIKFPGTVVSWFTGGILKAYVVLLFLISVIGFDTFFYFITFLIKFVVVLCFMIMLVLYFCCCVVLMLMLMLIL